MTEERPIGSCGRVLLLLSLQGDGAATPSQRAEIDAHLSGCAACRRAAASDAAVRRRIVERVDAPAPSWLAGFAQRTTALAIRQAREARSQNRLLWMSAAAALLVAAAVQFETSQRRAPSAPGGDETAAVRESTRLALIHRARLQRNEEGK